MGEELLKLSPVHWDSEGGRKGLLIHPGLLRSLGCFLGLEFSKADAEWQSMILPPPRYLHGRGQYCRGHWGERGDAATDLMTEGISRVEEVLLMILAFSNTV